MYYILLILAIVLSACTSNVAEVAKVSEVNESVTSSTSTTSATVNDVNTVYELPSTFKIRVPFTPQAPHANWDDPYQEACEEASLIMVNAYWQNYGLSSNRADDEIKALVNYQTAQGLGQDITIEQVAQIAEEYYGFKTRMLHNPTIEDIKREISWENPVIIPAAGRKLGNPYFSGAGPWYHMLVVTGYDRNEFITNDPGTKRGKGYKYKYQTLMDAIHDWTGVKEEIETGPKKALAIYKGF
jgi:uncharacterized protein YvpB